MVRANSKEPIFSVDELLAMPELEFDQLVGIKTAKQVLLDMVKDGVWVLRAWSLWGYLGLKAAPWLSRERSLGLARVLERMGLAYIPHPDYMRVSEPGSWVGIAVEAFPKDFSPTAAFDFVIAALQLVFKSLFSSKLDNGEASFLRKFVSEYPGLTSFERANAHVFIDWGIASAGNDRVFDVMASSLNERDRQAVVCTVFSMSRKYKGDTEMKNQRLRHLLERMGLYQSKYLEHMRKKPSKLKPQPTKREGIRPKTLNPIGGPSRPFRLDADLMEQRQQETTEVQSLLKHVFVELADEAPVSVAGSPTGVAPSLSPEYLQFLNLMLSQETWERNELERHARHMGLMLDGAIEVLNELAFEQAGCPLIEGDSEFDVDFTVANSLLARA